MLHSARFLVCLIGLLILVFCFRCHRTYRVFNDTSDEAAHILCGLEVWQTGRYTMEAQHPPLARAVVALPPYVAGLRLIKRRDRKTPWSDALWVDSKPEFYWRTLSLARLGNLAFAPFLLVYVYLWGRRLYGPAAGLAAAGLVSFSPNLLAHASLATLDFGAATTTFISTYHFWRWSREPGLRNCLLACVAFAIAVLTKFSALFFLPLIAAIFFVLARWRQWSWRPSAQWLAAMTRGAVFLSVAGLIIWSAYLFDRGPLPFAQIGPVEGTLGQYLESAVEIITRHGIIPLPAPYFVRGVLEVLDHDAQGHRGYLLGEIRRYGSWYYFPVVLAVKTTLPFLLLVAMALILGAAKGAWGAEGGPARSMLCPLLAAAMVLGVSMSSNMNLGVRHILVIYPFLALAASGLFVGGGCFRPAVKRVVVGFAMALAIWHAAESFLAHPDYLAYFNQIARGREEEFLLDSNLDWGQDLERLRRYLEANKISTLYLSFFGATDPSRLGMTGVRRLPPGEIPPGWVALSKNHIAGLGHQAYFPWVKGHSPVARIGKSILLYHFSR